MKKKFVLSFIISFMCFGLIFIGLGKMGLFKNRSTIAVDGEVDSEFAPGNVSKPKIKKEILFLLMGVDANGMKNYSGIRTDTMMLFKVNFETGQINLLSIPRDTRVLMTVKEKQKEDKINHAHSFGGTTLTMRTLRDFLNLDLDYYVKVDYKAVQVIVDAMDGVDINVPRNMKYDDPTAVPPLHINIEKGQQILDGKNAHDFLRWRHNNDMTLGYAQGDIGRIEAQQMFMKELIKQSLKLKNIPKLVETYFGYVETNIPLDTMIKGALSAKKIDMEKMQTNTIPGEGKKIAKVDYWIYNIEETKAIVEEMFGDYLLGQ